jgi:hypothetical protein
MKLHQYELAVLGAEETQDGYVLLAHGQRYSLRISNDGSMRCDVELTIDGNHVGTFRLEGQSSAVIERPVVDDGFFTFYELVTEEARKSGLTSHEATGLVTAVFKPEALILFSSPSPGGTGLSGHSKQEFTSVRPLHYANPEDFVTINLRLGGTPVSDIRPLVKRQMSTPVPHPLS